MFILQKIQNICGIRGICTTHKKKGPPPASLRTEALVTAIPALVLIRAATAVSTVVAVSTVTASVRIRWRHAAATRATARRSVVP